MKQKLLSVLLAGAAGIGAFAATTSAQDEPAQKVGTVDMWGNEWSPFLSCKQFSFAPGCSGLKDTFDTAAAEDETDDILLVDTLEDKIQDLAKTYEDAKNPVLEKEQRLALLVQAYAQAKDLWANGDVANLPPPFNNPKDFASEVQQAGNEAIGDLSQRMADNVADGVDIYVQYDLAVALRDTIDRLDSTGVQRGNDSYAKLGTVKDKFEADIYATATKVSTDLLSKMDAAFNKTGPTTAIEQTWNLQYLNHAFGVMSEIKPEQKAELSNTYCQYRAIIAPQKKSNICAPTVG